MGERYKERVTQQYSFHLVLLVKLSDERSMTTHHMKNHANKPCPSQNHSQTKAPITRQMIVIGKMNIVKGYFNPFIHFKFPNWPKSTKFQNLNSKLSPEKKSYSLIQFLIFFSKCSRFQMHSFSPIFFSFTLKHTLKHTYLKHIFTKQCS